MHEIAVGADVEAGGAIFRRAIGGGEMKDEDRRRLGIGLESPADLPAVDVREIDVENDEVDALTRERERIRARARLKNAEARLPQRASCSTAEARRTLIGTSSKNRCKSAASSPAVG